MKKIIILLILILSFTKISAQDESEADTLTQNWNVKINIPTEWIEKIRQYDYHSNNSELLKEFEHIIQPISFVCIDESVYEEGGFLNPLFINLDSDKNEELIGLFGWSEFYPSLAVFKYIDTSWCLIYLEPLYVYYFSPELQVANVYSANKTFYIRCLYERGTGIYRDAYHFYKLINNNVYPCLQQINESRLCGWGLYLNQEVEMNFEFYSAHSDEIKFIYKYNFFPGAVYEKDLSWECHDELSLVSGKDYIYFEWDTIALKYKLRYEEDNINDKYLKEQKILCFGTFGNDTIFVKAFESEINQTLENGTEEQKKLLNDYLKIVKKDKKAVSPFGELEDKGKVGGLKIYGTKKKISNEEKNNSD